MSSSEVAASLKARAFQCLLNEGTLFLHPAFTIANITRAEHHRCTLDVPVNELGWVTSRTPGAPLPDLIDYGWHAAKAAWVLGFVDEVPKTQSMMSSAEVFATPKPDEILRIRGEVEMKNGVPELKFAITASRKKVNVAIVMGIRTLTFTSPTSTSTPPPTSTSSNAPSSSGPAPPTTRKRASAPTASGPLLPSAKRPALPTESSQPLPAASSSLKPAPTNPPPPPPLARLASQLAKTSIIAPLQHLLWSPANPHASTSAAPVPIVRAPPETLDEKRSYMLRTNSRLVNDSPFRQKYMWANVHATKPERALQLKKVLGEMGLVPSDIDHVRMFVGRTPIYNFVFNIASGDETKMEEKIFNEEEWTRVFNITNIMKFKPFFSKPMQIGVFFQTTLVATRIDRPNIGVVDREAMVWSRLELKRALENERVKESLEPHLTEEGQSMMRRFKRELI